MKKLIAIIIVFHFSFLLQAESSLDSAFHYVEIEDYESAIKYSRKVLSISNNKDLQGEALFTIGYCYDELNQPAKAIFYYQKSHNKNQRNFHKARALVNIGLIYRRHGLYKEALLEYSNGIKLNEDLKKEGSYLLNRTVVYKKLAEYDLAYTDAKLALEIGQELKDIRLIYRAYNQLGLIKQDAKEYTASIQYFQNANALDYKKKTFINLGLTYFQTGDFDKVLEACLSAREHGQNSEQTFKSYQLEGETRLKLQDYDLALIALKEAENLLEQVNYVETEDLELFKTISAVYEAKGNYEMSAYYLKINLEKLTAFADRQKELISQYSKQKLVTAEKQIAIEEEQNAKINFVIKWAGIAIAVLFVLLGVFFFFSSRRKKKSTQLKELIKAKLNEPL